jgi:hypothetical protein
MTQGMYTVNKLTSMCSRKGTRESARDTHCKQVNNCMYSRKGTREKASDLHCKQVHNYAFTQKD